VARRELSLPDHGKNKPGMTPSGERKAESLRSGLTESPDPQRVPRLSDEQVETSRGSGNVKDQQGEVLYAQGEPTSDFS
jgi:hypothetical protein